VTSKNVHHKSKTKITFMAKIFQYNISLGGYKNIKIYVSVEDIPNSSEFIFHKNISQDKIDVENINDLSV
jgi:hypothetical protein